MKGIDEYISKSGLFIVEIDYNDEGVVLIPNRVEFNEKMNDLVLDYIDQYMIDHMDLMSQQEVLNQFTYRIDKDNHI